MVRVVLGHGWEGEKKVHVGLTSRSKDFGFCSEWEGLWATWSALGFPGITLAAVKAQPCLIVLWTPLLPLTRGCNMTPLLGGVVLEDVNSPLLSMLPSHCCSPGCLSQSWVTSGFLQIPLVFLVWNFSILENKRGSYMVAEEIMPRLAVKTYGVEFMCFGQR